MPFSFEVRWEMKKKIKIGSTPTHTFTIPYDTSLLDIVEITYSQRGQVVLQKREDDCTMEDDVISVKLKERDTFLFDSAYPVEIQMRIGDKDGTVIPSDIINVSCARCLSQDVLS